MRVTVILAIFATLAIGAGGLAVSQLYEARAVWLSERQALSTRIAELEDEAAGQMAGPAASSADRPSASDLAAVTARLAEIETQILDGTAELAELESDRIVAEDRSQAAFQTIRDNVRVVAEIEQDVKRLGDQRLALRRMVEQAEKQLVQTAAQIADRRKQVERIDRQVADLAIRRETAKSRLYMTKRMLATEHDRLVALEAAQQDVAVQNAAKKPTPVPDPEPAVSAELVAATDSVEDGSDPDRDRGQGLYQFERLAVGPADGLLSEVPGDGADTEPASSTDNIEQQSPSDAWAEQQYMSALVLMTTAERNSGTRELNEAVLAFKAVLSEWPKARDPMRWAIARNDLGYALALLGQRTNDVTKLESAAQASREALAEFKREETPILWAGAQHYLGVSLSGLASIKNDKALWQNAIEALQQSFEVFEANGAAAEAAKSARRLEDAQERLAAWRP